MSPTQSMRSRTALTCGALVVLTLLAYHGVLENGFVDFDDDTYITQNPAVLEGLSLSGVAWAFTTTTSANWHPLTWLSHMLDVELFGVDPAGHHAMSVLLHTASVLLLFIVLHRMTAAFWPSAFVAALLAVHPLHVESVAWAAERKDVLSTFLWMLTLLAYARYAERPDLSRYAWVFVGLLAGLMAKPMLVTLPFALLLLDHWPLARRIRSKRSLGAGAGPARPRFSDGRLVLEKAPLFALVAASSAVTYLVQRGGGAVAPVPVDQRLANALVSYAGYVVKMVWPTPLAVMYPFPDGGHPSWKTLAAFLFVASITAGTLYLGRRHQYLSVGWLWYLGTLVPVVGLVQVGYQSSADRYMYVPSIGLSIAIVWGMAHLTAPRFHTWVAVIASVALFGLVLTTSAQVGRWRDSRTLFEHAVGVVPDNYPMQVNLAGIEANAGNVDKAIDYLEAALRSRPDLEHAHYNLAVQLQLSGRTDEATEHYRRALELAPDYVSAHKNLGLILMARNKQAEAIPHLEVAVNARPEDARLRFELAGALQREGALDEAIRQYREVLRTRPDVAAAHTNLALALEARGETEQAERHRAEARRLSSR